MAENNHPRLLSLLVMGQEGSVRRFRPHGVGQDCGRMEATLGLECSQWPTCGRSWCWILAQCRLSAGMPWFSPTWPLCQVTWWLGSKNGSQKQSQKPQIPCDPVLGLMWCYFCCVLLVKTSPGKAKVKGREIDPRVTGVPRICCHL